MRKTTFSILATSLVVSLAVLTPSQSGGQFAITRSTIAGGGNASSGGPFALTSAVGEAASGMTGSGGGFGVGLGFWTVLSTGYVINGLVLQSNGRGITGATATLSGGPLQQPRIQRTTRNGLFQFDNVVPGYIYTVAISARRFTFTPTSQNVSVDSTLTGLTFTGAQQSGPEDMQR